MSTTDWKFGENNKATDGRAHITHFDMDDLQKKPPAKLMGKPRRVSATPAQFKMLLETWATKNEALDAMLDSYKDFIKASNPNKHKRTAFMKTHAEVWSVEAWSSDAWPMRSNKALTPEQKRLRKEFSGNIQVRMIHFVTSHATFCHT